MSAKGPGRPRTQRPDLQPFTARLTPEAKKRLMALSQVTGDPAYELLEQAFWDRWEHLPEGHRRAAEAIVAAVESARSGARSDPDGEA